MSNQPIDDAELLEIIKNERERLEQAAEAERQALIEQRVRELLAEEQAVERLESEREAEIRSAELAYDPARERDRARETAKSAALLLIMLLLILLLVAAATGRTDILPFPGVQATPAMYPHIASTAERSSKIDLAAPTFPPGVTPEVDPFFRTKYEIINGFGKECSIGDPISQGYIEGGLHYQWFERALLKEMPAGSTNDPDWAIQSEPLGQQVTTGMSTPFPTAIPFVSNSNAYYFRQTGHSVEEPFLDFWTKCPGMWLLGYPVSDQVYENVVPGRPAYLVQYFERGRLEYHQDDPTQQVQFGLLGSIKAQDKDFKPLITMPPYPNAPPSATPMPAPILAATVTQLPAATATTPPAATAAPAATPTPAGAPSATIYPAP